MYMPAFACVTSHDNACTYQYGTVGDMVGKSRTYPLLFKVRNIGDLHDFINC